MRQQFCYAQSVHKRNRGFSLLEVLVGFTIFVVALLLVFSFFPNAKRSAVMAKNRATANNLAKELLERERALPYNDVGNVTPAAVAPPELFAIPGIVDGQNITTNFEATIRVTELEPDKLKEISVEISWMHGSQRHKFLLETYKPQYSAMVGP